MAGKLAALTVVRDETLAYRVASGDEHLNLLEHPAHDGVIPGVQCF